MRCCWPSTSIPLVKRQYVRGTRGTAMMIKMVPADMRRAAAAWDSASEQVKKANPVARVGDVSTAMPGSASASQVGSLVGVFDGRFDEWCTDATDMGESYRAVADDHHTTDQSAGDEGRKQVGAVSTLATTWAVGASPAQTISSGPAIFDPGAPSSDRMDKLINRLGEFDS